jgi:hypothetical protein
MNCKFLRDYRRWSLVLARNFHSSPASLKKKMPPKKAAAPEKKILLGRPSNNLKIGIVGTWHPLYFPSLIPTPPQVCQMSANLHSLMCYPIQVRFPSFYFTPTDHHLCRSLSHPSTPSRHWLNLLLDLGKAFNYPFATIEPEVTSNALLLSLAFDIGLYRKPESRSQTLGLIGFAISTNLCPAFLPSLPVWILPG